MNDEITDLDEMLGFLSEEGQGRKDPDAHPSPEELSAYQAGELSKEEDERIQDHLAICKHCTGLLLDLEEFLAPPAVAEPAADFEAAADWRRLREGMKRDEKRSTPARPDRRRFFASVWGGYSVAAALLAISVGLGFWNGDLARRLREPQALQTTRTLSARGSSRGSEGSGSEPVTLPAQIILTLPTYELAPSYQVAIFRQERGKLQWSLDVPQENGDLSFILPARSLRPGTYSLHVAAHGTGQPGWEYRLSVSPPPGRVSSPRTQ